MADVLITIDTELSPGLHQCGVTPAENHVASIEGRAGGDIVGVGWQMDRLEAHGLRGVFFVDPMPALVYGPQVLPPIVAPIRARGHEVQLHIHTEWLAWVSRSPVGGRQGRNIGDFEFDDQLILIALARNLLQAGGAPRPTAFRAGNFGADARTLLALRQLGFAWDSSVNEGFAGSLPTTAALGWAGELPVSGLIDRPGHVRPAQICALSRREMTVALRHAADHPNPFVIVSHSFEMLSRDRRRANRAVMARFDAMCRTIATTPGLRSSGFDDLAPPIETVQSPMLRSNGLRTVGRMIEQAVATLRYERT